MEVKAVNSDGDCVGYKRTCGEDEEIQRKGSIDHFDFSRAANKEDPLQRVEDES